MIYLGKTSVGIAAISGATGDSMQLMEIDLPDLSVTSDVVITSGQRVLVNDEYVLMAI